MGGKSRFESLISSVPVDNNKLIGQAVGWFIQNQNPISVEFKKYNNGYQIHVYADEESVQEAAEFWEEYVNPHLSGD